MTCSRGSAICLYVFSGPHLGACVELTEGSWVVGSDDACDIILTGLAPRHAVLDISSEENAFPVLAVTPLDGPLRLQGGEPVEPAEADGPLRPAAGSAWYLGTTCFAWNRPGVPQESLVPELSPLSRRQRSCCRPPMILAWTPGLRKHCCRMFRNLLPLAVSAGGLCCWYWWRFFCLHCR